MHNADLKLNSIKSYSTFLDLTGSKVSLKQRIYCRACVQTLLHIKHPHTDSDTHEENTLTFSPTNQLKPVAETV